MPALYGINQPAISNAVHIRKVFYIYLLDNHIMARSIQKTSPDCLFARQFQSTLKTQRVEIVP